MNFLQAHYNRYRDEGGSHIEYAIWNDLSDETANELKKNYKPRYRVGFRFGQYPPFRETQWYHHNGDVRICLHNLVSR